MLITMIKISIIGGVIQIAFSPKNIGSIIIAGTKITICLIITRLPADLASPIA